MTEFDLFRGAGDTIYAPATAPGRAAVAIVRVSGPDAPRVIEAFVAGSALTARYAVHRSVIDPECGEVIDHALVLRFDAGASYTGEACVEFHVHGGPMVSARLSTALERFGVRLAKPGEFTARAFHAGRLDLSQIEAISGVIEAETEAARRQAMGAMDGEVGRYAARWRDGFLEIAALLESGIDFADEDLGEDVFAAAVGQVRALRADLAAALETGAQAERIGRPLTIAIIGPPNAGKSSLLNALAGRDAAIVSPSAGTTRDPISVVGRIGRSDFEITDTAGLRRAEDQIEREGVARARTAAERADRRILVLSADTYGASDFGEELLRPGDLALWNKADLSDREPPFEQIKSLPLRSVSTLDGSAVRIVEAAVENWSQENTADLSVAAATGRRRSVIATASTFLDDALSSLNAGRPEMAVESLRSAATAIEELVGRWAPDDVLGAIFARFCIGK